MLTKYLGRENLEQFFRVAPKFADPWTMTAMVLH